MKRIASPDRICLLLTLTLLTVAASILIHGISVQPVMKWYARHKPAPGTAD